MRLLAINSTTEDGDILCSTQKDFNASKPENLIAAFF